MKKSVSLLLVLLLTLSLLAGCGQTIMPAQPLQTPTPTQELQLLPDPTDPPAPAETETPAQTAPPQTPAPTPDPTPVPTPEPTEPTLPEDGSYTTKEDVALYLHIYGHLPPNFITKKQAQALGWSGGSLERYAPGKCIGGSTFGNYEGLLPAKKGRSYTECDIDTLYASSRGAKRIVFSNDGLIYYTDDHYESFTLLYGEED